MPDSNLPTHEAVTEYDAVILGAGVSGLARARRLHDAGKRVLVVDKAAQIGGAVRSRRREGFLCEEGPNSMLVKSQEVWEWLHQLGLSDSLLEADPASANRFLVKKGRLVPMPRSPWQAVTTPLYSPAAKLRLLAEPFIPKTKLADESVSTFVSRRMGPEFLEYGISALVSGIFAGDPDRLSLTHAFPKVWNLEQTYGSLIRGAVGLKRDRRKQGIRPFQNRMVSFLEGLAQLTSALAAPLPDSAFALQTELAQATFLGPRQWEFRLRGPSAQRRVRAGQWICTVPLHQYPNLPFLANQSFPEADAVPYPPLSTVVLGFPRDRVAHPLNGFGALFPRLEKRFSLGVIFSSSLFPHRAPPDQVSLMVFVGGVQQPDNATLPTNQLIEHVLADLQPLLGLRGEPTFSHHTFWPRAIPQYPVGHRALLDELQSAEAAFPGLSLTGNFRGGPGLHDCLANARAIA